MRGHSMPYKICHVSSVHDSYDNRIMKKECHSLAKAGYDVYFVVAGESFEECGVNVVGIGLKPQKRIKRMFQFSKKAVVKALEIDADLYHLHDPELLLYAMRFKRAGKKVVFDSHEIYRLLINQKEYLPRLLRKCISKLYTLYENYVFDRIDGIVVPCSINGEYPYKEVKTKHAYVNNLPILEKGKCTDRIEKDSNAKFTACAINGSLTYERGIKHIIQAAEIADCNLIIAGNFVSDEFEAEIRSLPYFAKVDYRGFVNRDGVKEILAESDVGLSTLLNVGQYASADNLPTKIYDYMAAGLPVIASNTRFIVSENKKYNFLLPVDPSNVHEIADALIKIKENSKLGNELGENGRKVVFEKYNWEKEKDNLLTLYSSLLNC